jgi:hypothetical protein
MKEIEMPTLHIRKRIYHYCIKENVTMEKTAEFIDVPFEVVKSYVSFYTSSIDEQRKMKNPVEAKLLDLPKQHDKFTGYYTELTEEQMLSGGEIYTPVYSADKIENMSVSYNFDRRSYQERLSAYKPNLDIVKKYNSVKERSLPEADTHFERLVNRYHAIKK